MIELRNSQTQIPIDTNVNDRVEEIAITNPIDTNVNDKSPNLHFNVTGMCLVAKCKQ